MTYLAEKENKEATQEFRHAIQIDPQFAQARYQLGLLYLKTGEVSLAVEELQRAATLQGKRGGGRHPAQMAE